MCAAVLGAGAGWLAARSWDPPEVRLARALTVAERRYGDCEAKALVAFAAAHPLAQRELEGTSVTVTLLDLLDEATDPSHAEVLRDPKKGRDSFVQQRCQREKDEYSAMGLAATLFMEKKR